MPKTTYRNAYDDRITVSTYINISIETSYACKIFYHEYNAAPWEGT